MKVSPTSIFKTLLDVVLPPEPSTVWTRHVPVNVLDTCTREHVWLSENRIAPLVYKNKRVQTAVHALKYEGERRAAELLVHALAPFIADMLGELRMFGSYESVVLIPVPLGQQRQKQRGYNQSELLAAALIRELQDPYITLNTKALVRRRETSPLTLTQSKEHRAKSMARAFLATDHFDAESCVFLMDDVTTTGATLTEASKALKAKGARSVMEIAVAH
jgi:ComF family protein